MKKLRITAIILSLILIVGIFSACGNNGNNGDDDNNENPIQLVMSTVTYDDTTKLVTWSEVINASNYLLTLTGQGVNKTTTIATASKNASTNKYEYEIAEETSANYTVSIIAKGDGTNYLDSVVKTTMANYTKIANAQAMSSEKWDKVIDDSIIELTKTNANYKLSCSYLLPNEETEERGISYFFDSNKIKIENENYNGGVTYIEFTEEKYYLYSSNDNGITFNKKETNPIINAEYVTLAEATIKPFHLDYFKGHFEDFDYIDETYIADAMEFVDYFNLVYNIDLTEYEEDLTNNLNDKEISFKIKNGLITEFIYLGLGNSGDTNYAFPVTAMFTYGGQTVTLPEVNNNTSLTQEEFDQIAAATLAYIEDKTKYFGFKRDEEQIRGEEVKKYKDKCFSQGDKYCFENEDGTIDYYYFEGNLMHKYIQDSNGKYLYYQENSNENYKDAGRDVAIQIAIMVSATLPFAEFDGIKYRVTEDNFAVCKQACIEAANKYFGSVHNDMIAFEFVEFSFIISDGMITEISLIIQDVETHTMIITVLYWFTFGETLSIELPEIITERTIVSLNDLPSAIPVNLELNFDLISLAHGIDPKTVSVRARHANVGITLNVYTHRTSKGDRTAADIINKVLSI